MISDWDCLAVDEQSKSTNGVFVSPRRVRIAVNANYLISIDSVMTHNVRIRSGQLQIDDAIVVCDIGPKDGIYFAIYSEDPFRAMIGIAAKGYMADEGYVGIEREDVEWLKEIMGIWSESVIPMEIYEKLITIDLDAALRHNQGDAQISHEFNAEIPATKPGAAQEPLLASALKIAQRENQ
jgi:hypothetical protein